MADKTLTKQYSKTINLQVVPSNNTPAVITLQVPAGNTGTVVLSGPTPASNSFTTIVPTTGTNPVASSPTDTLTIVSGDSSVSITGNSGTKTLDIRASSGSGNVSGPASSTDTALVAFNGTTGKIIKNSGATIDGSGNITSNSFIGAVTGNVTGNCSGSSGSCTGNASTVTTNANLTGDVTSSGNATTVVKINGTTLSGLATGILKNTTSTGVPSIAVAGDFPTLNQNTSGNAATVTTNANLTGPVTSTGNTTAIANGAITNAMLANGAVANLSGTNTGDQTNISGNAATVTTNANLTGDVTSSGNATTLTVVCARYHSSSSTITSSLGNIAYTTKDIDTASAYSTATYTVATKGKYLVNASLQVTDATIAAGNTGTIQLNKNSSPYSSYSLVSGAVTDKPLTLKINDLVDCAVNDTLVIQASLAGTTPTIVASTTFNYLSITRIGT